MNQICGNYRKRQHLAWEIDFLQQFAVHKHNLAGIQQRHLEEHPRQIPNQQVCRIIGNVESHYIFNDNGHRRDLEQRVHQRPEETEDRVLVTHLQVTHNELFKQVFIFKEFSQFVNHILLMERGPYKYEYRLKRDKSQRAMRREVHLLFKATRPIMQNLTYANMIIFIESVVPSAHESRNLILKKISMFRAYCLKLKEEYLQQFCKYDTYLLGCASSIDVG